MGAIFSFSLAASVVILLIFPVLHQIVNRSMSFRFNRIVIIGVMALSLIIPFLLGADSVAFHDDEAVATEHISVISADLTTEAAPLIQLRNTSANHALWIAAMLLIYFSGVIIFLCREAISFIRLFRLISNCEKTRYDGFTICCLTDIKMALFSWGNYIFLHHSEFQEAFNGIYLHEKAHTAKRHWVDVLFADLLCMIMWYNPAAWMTRRLMKLNHEFEADFAVIQSGIATYDYQKLLVIKAMGMNAIPVVNNFAADKRGFRKRVLIMSKRRSPKKTMLLALFALPAFVMSGFAINSPLSVGLLNTISDYEFGRDDILERPEEPYINETANFALDSVRYAEEKTDTIIRLPSPLNDQKALAEVIRLSLSTVELDVDTKINIGIVLDEEGRVSKVLITGDVDNALVNAIVDRTMNGIRFEQTTQNGKPIKMRFNLPVSIKKKA